VEKVSQHYVPRFYLEKFAGKPGAVLWEHDLETGIAQPSTAQECGCENLYHAVEQQDGTVDTETIENELAKVESAMAQLYKPLRARKQLSSDQWNVFHQFAALMSVRVPRFVDKLQNFLTEVLSKSYAIASHQPTFIADCVSRGVAKEDLDKFDVKAARGFALTMSLRGARTPHALFSQMTWCFFIAPEKRFFVTGDCPVRGVVPNWNSPFPPGLADREIEMTFPLSRSLCAVGVWSEKSTTSTEYRPVDEKIVGAINGRTIMGAQRFVYAPTEPRRVN
jgi:hypothetical protein